MVFILAGGEPTTIVADMSSRNGVSERAGFRTGTSSFADRRIQTKLASEREHEIQGVINLDQPSPACLILSAHDRCAGTRRDSTAMDATPLRATFVLVSENEKAAGPETCRLP